MKNFSYLVSTVYLCAAVFLFPVKASSQRRQLIFKAKLEPASSMENGTDLELKNKLIFTIPGTLYFLHDSVPQKSLGYKRRSKRLYTGGGGGLLKNSHSRSSVPESQVVSSASQDSFYSVQQDGARQEAFSTFKNVYIPDSVNLKSSSSSSGGLSSSSSSSSFDSVDPSWGGWYSNSGTAPEKYSQSISYGYQAGDKGGTTDFFSLYGPGPPKSHQSFTLYKTPEYETGTSTYWPGGESTTPKYDLPPFMISTTPYFPYKPPTIPYTTTPYVTYGPPTSTTPYVTYGPPTTTTTTTTEATPEETTMRTSPRPTSRRTTTRPARRIQTVKTTTRPPPTPPVIQRRPTTRPTVTTTTTRRTTTTTVRTTLPPIRFIPPPPTTTTTTTTTPVPTTLPPSIAPKILVTEPPPPEYETEPPVNFGPGITAVTTPAPVTTPPVSLPLIRPNTTTLPPVQYGVPSTIPPAPTSTTTAVPMGYGGYGGYDMGISPTEYGVPGQEPGSPIYEYTPATTPATFVPQTQNTYGVPGHVAGEPLGEYEGEASVQRRVQKSQNIRRPAMVQNQRQNSGPATLPQVPTPALHFLPPPPPPLNQPPAPSPARRQVQFVMTTTTEEPSIWSLFGL